MLKINTFRKSSLFILFFLLSSKVLFAQLDTCDCNKNKPFVFPAALIAYGSLSMGKAGFPSSEYIKNQRNIHYPNFHTKIDDYIVFAPSALPFALDLAGIKGRHNFKEKMVLYGLSMGLNMAIVNGLKYSTKILRPDGSTKDAFPSGHTAFAFGGAQFLHKEYGYRSLWYSAFGYATATTTGGLRILNNRHWFSDVVVGAGIAMLSTEVIYRVYPKIKSKIFKPKNEQKHF